jgi:hypothetical protein
MKRFCTVCTQPIVGQRKGAIYCGQECRKTAKNEARAALAGKRCRLCGRTRYKPKMEPRGCAPSAQMELQQN